MPPASPRRQPARSADLWFRSDSTRRLVHEVQRQVVPELTRVFGRRGLYLRPADVVAPTLSGNLLAEVVSVARDGDAFGGEIACRDDRLPFAGGTLSLVYALFVLETSPAPQVLLEEIARALEPEGVAILLTLNPWSPARARWAFRGLSCIDPGELGRRVRDVGLEVQRARHVGPVWSPPERVDVDPGTSDGPASRLRMAYMTVARRRDPGMTPLRAGSPALAFRPGMSAG